MPDGQYIYSEAAIPERRVICMKKKIGFSKKRLTGLCVALSLLVSIFAMPSVSAYSSIQKAGTYIGEATYTDIVTYINHYAIPSWIVNGYPMVAVEDLDKYGFDVLWNESERTLRIFRNYDKTYPSPIPVYLPETKLLGTKQFDVYASDVKVYANEYEYQMQGFSAIPGYTLIYVGDLTSFGATMYFVKQNKSVNVWIDGMSIAEYQRPTTTKAPVYNVPQTTLTKDKDSSTTYYDYIDYNMPDWARETITKLVNKGYIVGDAYGRLRLTEEDLRYYVVNDRAGIYGN